MSDDSLEGVVTDTVSEPVQDTKESAVEVEVKTKEVETETKEAEVEEKKLSKYELEVAAHAKTKDSTQKRMNRMTAASKAETEKRIALEAQVKELTPAVVDNRPNEDTFDGSYDEFRKAEHDYDVKKEVESIQLANKQAELDKAIEIDHAKGQKAFIEKAHAFRIENPSYDENSKAFGEQANYLLSQKGADNPTLSAINGLLLESELAVNLINELGSKPEFVEELAEMTPMNAIRELIKLESSYGTVSQETKPLPKPIKGVKGKGSPSKNIDDESPSDLMKRLGL